ncbi:radical SAM protein [Anaerosacchariphilus polymeriproducens]|uniref:Radical SAM protein n=1 Tax=Anaerosacchariphilus polymeriproducens TaxID=1812858 RepID=A0A371AUV1_9FIRM|nr:radical SAM protein [Anaerosacchariphilus polymeriproducens]RDU23354.1 radical SAM protein [Anaerosacchariphilus polymeriproducens]
MKEEFNLENYLSSGVEKIVKNALKATLSNPKESLFMAKYAIASKQARRIRAKAEEQGEHIPPFLIASITSECNLHCAGCYARANHSCHDQMAEKQLNQKDWQQIFEEAKSLGVGFILLAGGEPLIRTDIIKNAGKIQEILFPIFTNGTMVNKEYIKLFDKYRNLVPILSIEGNENKTDERRGSGVYQQLVNTMEELKENNIIYGTSVTITTQNLEEVTSKEFLDQLYERDCKVVIYVEYVPVDKTSIELAPLDKHREYLKLKLESLREEYETMLFISFPGDEKTSGGCLAAGRGFFHINSQGGVEPCPFSPYSDTNLKEISLREAMKSPLFQRLKENDVLMEEHAGGCVLFEKEELVRDFLTNK